MSDQSLDRKQTEHEAVVHVVEGNTDSGNKTAVNNTEEGRHHHYHQHNEGMNQPCCDGGHHHDGQDSHNDNDHDGHGSHHHSDTVQLQTPTLSVNLVCLAIVQDDGTNVVVFDVNGVPRTFRYDTTNNNNVVSNNISNNSGLGPQSDQLCFHSHHHDDSMIGNILTPCFDEFGNHGLPKETCFCGTPEPHLHAHLKDPHVCSDNKNNDSNENPHQFLASEILLPVDNAGVTIDTAIDNKNSICLKVERSESMPIQCNSKDLIHYKSSIASTVATSKTLGEACMGPRRLPYSVQHDDHIDYLVHDTVTNDLYLEYPCGSCGKHDVHGKFRPIGKRNLVRTNKDRLSNKKAKGDIHVQFFDIDKSKPFNIKEFLHRMFELNSDRVNTVDHMFDRVMGGDNNDIWETGSSNSRKSAGSTRSSKKSTSTSIGRSQFYVQNICCASEIPAIHKIIKPMDGVHSVSVNTTTKMVYVDHDSNIVSAKVLLDTLTKQGFGGDIRYDSGSVLIQSSTNSVRRSQFFVNNICCASEIPAINKILQPMEGVHAVSINTTTKTVYVDHDIRNISASELSTSLTDRGFRADIFYDGGISIGSNSNTYLARSTLMLQHSMSVDETRAIENKISKFFKKNYSKDKLEAYDIDLPNNAICIVHNPFRLTAQSVAAQLMESIKGIGVSVSVDGSEPNLWPFVLKENDKNDDNIVDQDGKFIYPRKTVIISGILWLISMLSYVGGKWDYLKYVALLSIAFGIPPIAYKAMLTLRRCQFDTNCLMFFASVGAVGLQDYSEAAAVVFLFALSEWLEIRATTRARQALSAIIQLRPDTANLVHPSTKELITIHASKVPVGAIVSARAGDKIPCDGTVVDGYSTVDESSLTGESRPIRKSPNDQVSGGTINAGLSPLLIQTTATSENSAVSRLIRLVEEAQANRSETEKLVDNFARVYTPIVLLAAIMMCTVSWAFGRETGLKWTNNGLILIVVACPCALIISTPVSYVAGIAAAAQSGVLIKGGAILEALGQIKHICFDKTGTLTNGAFSLLEMNVLTDSLSRDKVLQYLWLMEERASHPVSQAIIKVAQNESVILDTDMKLEDHAILKGEGVTGIINGLGVYVGNERMFERLELLHTLKSTDQQVLESWRAKGWTVGLMSIKGHGIVCMYAAADGVRREAPTVIASLRKLKICVTMLTGDNVDAALSVGQQIGLSAEEIKSRLLPEEKLSFIKHLAEGRKKNTILSNPFVKSKLVMMCGDGLNDAPALASSDVGVAMGTGAALSMETADVTLLDSNLEKVEFSIRLGRRVTAKIIQNVIFSLLVKIIVLAFAIEGKAQLWAAIASDVGAMLVVTLNSMMLLPRRNHRFSSGPMQVDVEDGQGAQGAQQVSGPDGFANTQSSKGSGTSCCGLGNAPRNTHQAGSCAKGCCSKSGIEDKKSGHETVQTECKKGCCGTGSAKSKPVCVNQNKLNKTDVKITCQEGCCGENKKTVDGPQSGDSTPCTAEQRNLATEIVIKPCQKECCGANKESCGTGSGESCCSGDKKIESESLKNTSCEKQCCGGSNKPDASLGTGHDKSKPTDTEDKKFDSFITEKTCQKRCCESSERADATRGVEAGESKLPDTDGIYLDSANTGKASSKGCCGQSKGNGIECDKHDSDKARKTCTGTAGCCGSSEKLDESSC